MVACAGIVIAYRYGNFIPLWQGFRSVARPVFSRSTQLGGTGALHFMVFVADTPVALCGTNPLERSP